jgi:hypothetical protein
MRCVHGWLRRPGAAPAIVVALVLVVFRRLLSGGQVLFERDLHAWAYPLRETLVRTVAGGSWPVWDPYVGFGQPMLANPEMQVLYPFTWLNLLLRPWTWWTLGAILHVSWAGLGLYALARQLGGSRGGALLAGASFAMGGPLLSTVNNVHHLTGVAWMPWVVWAAERAFHRQGLRDVLTWAGAATMLVFAGSGDVCGMTGLVLLLQLGAHLVGPPRENALRLVRLSAGAAALTLMLAAAQWVPTLQLATQSARRALGEEMRTYNSMPVGGLAEMAWPFRIEELPLSPDVRTQVSDPGRFFSSLYLGLPVLVLAAAAMAGPARRGRGLTAGVAFGATALALGKYGVAYPVFAALVPGATVLRFPSKFLWVSAAACALLAGMGVDAWREATARRFGAVVGGVGGALLGLGAALAWRLPVGSAVWRAAAATALVLGLLALRRRWPVPTAAVAAAVALAELGSVNDRVNPVAPRALLEHEPATAAALEAHADRRVYVYDYFNATGRGAMYLGDAPRAPGGGWTMPFGDVVALRTYLVPGVAATWAIPTSYDLDARGLYEPGVSELVGLLRRAENTPLHTRLLRLGAVGHMLSLHRRGLEDLKPLATFDAPWPFVIQLLEVPAALPRAHVTTGVRVGTGQAAVDHLLAPGYDVGREVVLEAGSARPPSGAGAARLTRLRDDAVEIEAVLDAPGHVVLVDAYDPGWQATVDGQPAPVLRANVAFRAVEVPAGRHVVEMRYRPRSVSFGLALSGLGLIAVAVLARRGLSSP